MSKHWNNQLGLLSPYNIVLNKNQRIAFIFRLYLQDKKHADCYLILNSKPFMGKAN